MGVSDTRALTTAAKFMREALDMSRKLGCLGPFVHGAAHALGSLGVSVDRVNVPASRPFGFHHPIHAVALLTWTREDGVEVDYRPHYDLPDDEAAVTRALQGSPYYSLVVEGQDCLRVNLSQDTLGIDLLEDLAEQGYHEYVALALPLPNGKVHPISLAARGEFLSQLDSQRVVVQTLLSSTLDSLYQGSAAAHLASTYIGPNAGARVLAGDFFRGNTQTIDAGVLFCDIRGFTALSARLGARDVVGVVNQIFEVVGETINRHGGEILKFMGDAVLAVFPVHHGASGEEAANAMVAAAREAVRGVAKLADELTLPLAVGFGGHVGEVLYGNIGTTKRLDFTVMGPAVNLASRLEGLCKKFDTQAVFSDEVGRWCDHLTVLGTEKIKGIDTPVDAWGFKATD